MHIAIAGNIGSGKTTLTRLLAQHFGWEPQYESVDDNPYLNDFYTNMNRWSFNLQIYFLNNRFQQIAKIKKDTKTVVQDRTIYEDARIFAPNLFVMELMSGRDYKTYQELFACISSFIAPPDLLIYLRASNEVLLRQIRQRGRSYEDSISPEYLAALNKRYEEWISTYTEGKLLIVDVATCDYANKPEDLIKVIAQVNEKLAMKA
jgi:deoxyadenosine/deoxycytidine kinase